jgi:hypothetical protein
MKTQTEGKTDLVKIPGVGIKIRFNRIPDHLYQALIRKNDFAIQISSFHA